MTTKTPLTDAVDIPGNWDTPDKLAALCREFEVALRRIEELRVGRFYDEQMAALAEMQRIAQTALKSYVRP